MRSRTPPTWPARAAAVWAFAFAALSVFWAFGGQLGLHPFESASPSTTLVLMNVLAAVAKVGLGLLALASISAHVRWSLLGVALWTAGLALLVYGALGMLSNGLVVAGIIDLSGAPTKFHWYFVLLWDPYFVLGGILFLLTAVAHRKAQRTAAEE